jgi:phosphohistidine phosphatase
MSKGGPVVSHAARDLYLLRHAKSSWSDATLDDHDRPLAPRGEKALRRLQRYMAQSHVAPTLVLCSSARRAVMTCEGVRQALPKAAAVLVEDRLYAASGDRLLERLRQVPDDIAGVLLVGHNPGLHMLAVSLVGDGDDALQRELASAFPTGALATLSVPAPWPDLAPGTATLRDLVTPRRLP